MITYNQIDTDASCYAYGSTDFKISTPFLELTPDCTKFLVSQLPKLSAQLTQVELDESNEEGVAVDVDLMLFSELISKNELFDDKDIKSLVTYWVECKFPFAHLEFYLARQAKEL